MPTPFESAQLNLQLFDLRREAVLREARNWFLLEFNPETFAELVDQPATGVFMRRVTFYFRRPVVEDHFQSQKMSQLRDHVLEFVHDPDLIASNGVNPTVELRDAYSHLAPMVDTDMYMNWLMGRVRQAGCQVIVALLSQASFLNSALDNLYCSGKYDTHRGEASDLLHPYPCRNLSPPGGGMRDH